MILAMEHFSIHHPHQVLLVDDSNHNISEAASSGFHTVIVSPDTAFEVSQVLDHLKSP
jgi:beta-phosphoglucomutase-like phosphatase (HAD superfamily)